MMELCEEAGIDDTSDLHRIERPNPFSGEPYACAGFALLLPPDKEVVEELSDPPLAREILIASSTSRWPNFADPAPEVRDDFALMIRFFDINSTANFLDTVFSITRADLEEAKTPLAAAALSQCIVMRGVTSAVKANTFRNGPTTQIYIFEYASNEKKANLFEITLCSAEEGSLGSVWLAGAGLDFDTVARIASGMETTP